jgi:hypothetical protein
MWKLGRDICCQYSYWGPLFRPVVQRNNASVRPVVTFCQILYCSSLISHPGIQRCVVPDTNSAVNWTKHTHVYTFRQLCLTVVVKERILILPGIEIWRTAYILCDLCSVEDAVSPWISVCRSPAHASDQYWEECCHSKLPFGLKFPLKITKHVAKNNSLMPYITHYVTKCFYRKSTENY